MGPLGILWGPLGPIGAYWGPLGPQSCGECPGKAPWGAIYKQEVLSGESSNVFFND